MFVLPMLRYNKSTYLNRLRL